MTLPAAPHAILTVTDLSCLLSLRYEGGAGYIFSQGALSRLVEPGPVVSMRWDQAKGQWVQAGPRPTLLDVCVSRALGGEWCYLHDDHLSEWGHC